MELRDCLVARHPTVRISGIEDPGQIPSLEVVRGRLDHTLSAELRSFWARRRALAEPEASRRLPEVVCVLRSDGEIVGASSVYPADLALIGGRRFWIYRSLLDHRVAGSAPEMIRATFSALEAEFDGSAEAPIGLCLLLSGPGERSRFPEAEPSDPHMIYAGYLDDGRQVRIAYFDKAEISMPPGSDPTREPNLGWTLPDGYRVEVFSEQDAVKATDVVALWMREGALRSMPERQRRVAEVLLVATDRERRPVGVSTTYLQRNDQLRAALWYTRVFVAAAHRRSNLAVGLAAATRDRLAERFVEGSDRRGIGMIMEVENEMLRRIFPQAVWPMTRGSAFIGESQNGSHIRVNYFPGALAPEPN